MNNLEQENATLRLALLALAKAVSARQASTISDMQVARERLDEALAAAYDVLR